MTTAEVTKAGLQLQDKTLEHTGRAKKALEETIEVKFNLTKDWYLSQCRIEDSRRKDHCYGSRC